jgi:hypothetical protein
MKKEIYSCDKCKKQVEKDSDLLCIEVKLKSYKYDSSYIQKVEVELCTSCAEKLGFVKRVVENDKIVNEPQDIKDKLYDVMVDLVLELGIEVSY